MNERGLRLLNTQHSLGMWHGLMQELLLRWRVCWTLNFTWTLRRVQNWDDSLSFSPKLKWDMGFSTTEVSVTATGSWCRFIKKRINQGMAQTLAKEKRRAATDPGVPGSPFDPFGSLLFLGHEGEAWDAEKAGVVGCRWLAQCIWLAQWRGSFLADRETLH